jgi:hypothetical protein
MPIESAKTIMPEQRNFALEKFTRMGVRLLGAVRTGYRYGVREYSGRLRPDNLIIFKDTDSNMLNVLPVALPHRDEILHERSLTEIEQCAFGRLDV